MTITQNNNSHGVPLSPAQADMWRQLNSCPDRAHFFAVHATSTFAPGSIDATTLELRFGQIIEENEILRSRFVRPANLDLPYQVVVDMAESEYEYKYYDFRKSDTQAYKVELASFTKLSFEQQCRGIVRCGLFEMADAQSLVIVLPALVSDDRGALVLLQLLLDEKVGNDTEDFLQYADVAQWLLELKDHEDFPESQEFWKKNKADHVVLPQPPFVHSRPCLFERHECSISVPQRLAKNLDQLAGRLSVPPEHIFAAIVYVLLWRYSGANQLTVAIRFPGRDDPELASLIGALATDLPLTLEVEPELTFKGLSALLFDRTAIFSRWQEFFDRQRATQEGHARACRIQFSFTDLTSLSQNHELLDFSMQAFNQPFDWALHVYRSATGYDIIGFADQAKYDEPELLSSIEVYLALLDVAVSDENGRIANIMPDWPLTVLESNNKCEAPVLADVATVLLQQSQSRPRATALFDNGRTISFTEFSEFVDVLAAKLIKDGLSYGESVGICCRRDAELVVAIHAVIRAGGIVVPIEPDLPEVRLVHIANDAGILRVLSNVFEVLPNSLKTRTLIRPDNQAEFPAWCADKSSLHDNKFQLKPEIEQAIYLIYTSGTTGTPKGVEISHKALMAYTHGVEQRLQLSVDAKMGTLSGVGADLGYTAYYVAPLTGRCLYMIDEAVTRDAHTLASMLAQAPLDFLKVVPNHLSALLAPLDDDQAQAILPRECIAVGGDRLEPALIERIQKLRPNCRIINHYGPTEFTIGALVAEIGDSIAPIYIGQPLGCTYALVLDNYMCTVPPGIPGQLYLGGPQLAIAYHGMADRTAEAFLPCIANKQPGARIYATGDLVRYNSAGNIEFIGRVDHQVKIRGFRVELAEVELAVRELENVRECVVITNLVGGHSQLLAYVSADQQEVVGINLREQLSSRLPEYMIPNQVFVLSELPMTNNGKVDRNRLPSPESLRESSEYTAPNTREEQVLCDLLADLLSIEQVGIHHNFFELGGDSIIGIQLAARARRHGLQFSAEQIFTNPTIAELANHAEQNNDQKTQYSAEAIKSPPLTPIQHRFFGYDHVDSHHYNQSQLLDVRADVKLDKAVLIQIADYVLATHSGLRRRFYQGESGEWQQFVQDMHTDFADRSVYCFKAGELNEKEWTNLVSSTIAEMQASLNLQHGDLFRMAWIEGGQCNGEPRNHRLLFVVHHLVVDYVSWNIILDDVLNILQQLEQGVELPVLPLASTEIGDWSIRQQEHTAQISIQQATYWQNVVSSMPALPVEHELDESENMVANADTLLLHLDSDTTAGLLQVVPAALGFATQELLLCALVFAFREWRGVNSVAVELESHGREALFDDVDLVRTVGWFTARYPIVLKSVDALSETLKLTRQQLRSIPTRGIGYGMLKYLADPDVRLNEAGAPQLSFNYLGQSTVEHGRNNEPFRVIPEPRFDRSEKQLREHLISINAYAVDGKFTLRLDYSTAHYQKTNIQSLLDGVNETLEQLAVVHEAEPFQPWTPADFSETGFDQAALDDWLLRQVGIDQVKKMEMLYPLSPIQHGMLFHSLLTPKSGVYILQLVAQLVGPVRINCLREAWSRIQQRHAIFRTSFPGLSNGNPQQLVWSKRELPWKVIDWSEYSAKEQEQKLETWLEQDRISGFDPDLAPLMRVMVVKLRKDTHTLIWSRHHAIVDGWSSATVINEVFAVYQQLVQQLEPTLPTVRPYRDYIKWLTQAGDTKQSELYWSRYMSDIKLPTPLFASPWSPSQRFAENEIVTLDKQTTTALKRYAQGHRTTLNVVTQLAWAVTLARFSGCEDVVFGATVSGRPESLDGVELMVGPFINTLPIRLHVKWSSVEAGLQQLHEQQQRRERYSHTPLTDIKHYAGLSADTAMFHSLFVFENFPHARTADKRQNEQAELRIVEARTLDKTSYPLTLLVVPLDEMRIRFNYLPECFSKEVITGLLDLYQQVLMQMAVGCVLPESLSLAIDDVATQVENYKASLPRIVMSGSFALDALQPVLEFWSQTSDLPFVVELAPYNQIFQELLQHDSISLSNTKGLNVILLRWEDWLGDGDDLQKPDNLRDTLSQFITVLDDVLKKITIPIRVQICPPSPRALQDFGDVFEECIGDLRGHYQHHAVVSIYEVIDMLKLYGSAENYYDETTESLAHLPYTTDASIAMATGIMRDYDSLVRPPYKVIVLDCDNTLWRGICGEDGADSVDITPAHQVLQEFMLDQRKKGVLLALCSRNNQEDVDAVFAREDMVLRAEHISAKRVNWLTKSTNIRSLAEELNLGLSSFVFIDDDPTQCYEVRTHCPQVLTLQIPTLDPDRFIKHVWALDQAVSGEQDKSRADFYSQDRERQDLQHSAIDLDAFIASLNIKYSYEPLSEDNIARAADLVQRTNQFNFTCLRFNSAELSARWQDGELSGWILNLSDRFGDYGRVGVVLYREEGTVWYVENILLSCRALGRAVETDMLKNFALRASEANIQQISIQWVQGERNTPAKNCFEEIARLADGIEEQGDQNSAVVKITPQRLAAIEVNAGAVENEFLTDSNKVSSKHKSSFIHPLTKQYQHIAERWNSAEAIQNSMNQLQQATKFVKAAYVAPETSTQQVLTKLYSKILNVELVGLHDGFFALGGNSLKAVQLVAGTREQLGVELALQSVFEAPSVRELAVRVDLLTGMEVEVNEEMEVLEF